MSKAEGKYIAIRFTEDIVNVSKIEGFTITGKQFDHIGGTLNDKVYQIEKVEKHTIDNQTILLTFEDISRFNNVEGPLTIDYDSAKGDTSGRGGPVQSFSVEFTPAGLEQKPNPIGIENIDINTFVMTQFKKVDYTNTNTTDYLTATAVVDVVFTYVGTQNP